MWANTLSVSIESGTYLKILPLMVTSEVKGHFLSMYCPSIASTGVLKPKNWLGSGSNTKSNLFVVSDSCTCLLGKQFLWVKEHVTLFLESSFVL